MFPVRFRSRSPGVLLRWETSPSLALRYRPWSGAVPPDRGLGPADAEPLHRDRAASSASATFAATDRDAGRRLHSRAPTARYGLSAATRRGPRQTATAAIAAFRRRRSSEEGCSYCAYRRCERIGSSAAAPSLILQVRELPGGVCRHRLNARN